MSRKFENLTPAEAAKRFQNDPSSVVFPIGSFILQFGLTPDEFKIEASSGRLIVHGDPVADGFRDCHVNGLSVMLWLAHPDTPYKFKFFFDRHEADQ